MHLFFKEHFQPERLKNGEKLYERRYLSPRPPKISLKHDHNWTRGNDQSGSKVEQQPVGRLVQQFFGEAPRAESSKPTESKPNPICDRSGKLEDTERVFVEKGKTFRSQEIVGKCFVNTIPPYTAINSRTNDYDKWLRKSVYNDKHTFNIGETIVENNMNDATHVDTHKMQT